MRRAADGTPKLHIAVWATDATLATSLRKILPNETDIPAVRAIRGEMANLIYKILEAGSIKWCPVLEDRSEIVVSRDRFTPGAVFRGKRVLLLGCGALGSWVAEGMARSRAKSIHLVDSGIVKPGILVRQNYAAGDIGADKTGALARRLRDIDNQIEVSGSRKDAFEFLTANARHLGSYDLIVDCTASSIFQMKLERDWRSFNRHTPPVLSLALDATAQNILAVVVGPNAPAGPWDAYMQLKRRLCMEQQYPQITNAFYSDVARANLFQPEPGCSDPTFVGSFFDVAALASASVNRAAISLQASTYPVGIFLSHRSGGTAEAGATADAINLQDMREVRVGSYKVRLAPTIFTEAHAWVRQNDRLHSPAHETGGLLWGFWDEALGIIWIFALSGPPRDSVHDPGHFICGVEGTADEHAARRRISNGACGFVGFWHTHPDMEARQSVVDILGMSGVVAGAGENQRRALMLIFGRSGRRPSAGIYIYEAAETSTGDEVISIRPRQIALPVRVV